MSDLPSGPPGEETEYGDRGDTLDDCGLWITEDGGGKPFVEYIVAELFDIVREVVAEVQAEEDA